MRTATIVKTTCQYNKEPISDDDMMKLREIAADCNKVRNYIYQRFGGIGGLEKLYPGYTVQNEMTQCGLREQLGLPSVYFNLAVFDALADIKCQWTKTKSDIAAHIGRSSSLSVDEKHYLRFLLKVNNAFTDVLNRRQTVLRADLQKSYEQLADTVDIAKMERYLCRQVRKYHKKLHSDDVAGFSISERAYRYGDHGIYLTIKEKRKRIFVPLTDNCQYKRQLYIKLLPEKKSLEIKVPIDVRVKKHADYTKQVGISLGMYTMFVTHEGHSYGEQFGEYQTCYADWVREQTANYNRNRKEGAERKKYHAKKQRMEERLHSYINMEINRFLRTEKPATIYIPKLPPVQSGGKVKEINYAVSMWQRGYIRKRLLLKCGEQSVKVVEVFGKGISSECSRCGELGKKKEGIFYCPACGLQIEEKRNTAQNVKKRGELSSGERRPG